MKLDGGPTGSRSVLLGGTLIALVAVIAGVLVGHFAWSTSTTTVRLSPDSSRFGRIGYAGPGSVGTSENGAGSDGSSSRLFGPGGGSSETGTGSDETGSSSGEPSTGSSETGSDSSGSSSGVSSSVTSKVDPALVDIDTDLGLEDGKAAGTGMVVTSGGEVITNNHVITGATKITATDIGNGATYTARVVGYDHSHDIAVLQLEGASGLKTVSFGSSGSLEVGQSIATIGNAGGVGGTPSAASGQVGALDRSITAGDEIDGSQEHLSGLIEIDGDLQPGDSGGPLVDGSGEVIGMDTAASSTFQFQSSADEGFAIPIEQVKTIAKEILAGQSSSAIHVGATGLLGVFIRGQSSEGEGALVENVISGTPAASSGIGAGDVITALDETSVSSPTALTELILKEHPGDSVKVSWRTTAGERQSATVTLAEGPPE